MADTVFTQIGNVVGTEIQNLKDAITVDLTTETLARESADSTLTNSLNSEISNRTIANSTLQANIDSISTTLSTETTNRVNGDNTLQANIDTLVVSLSTETTNRIDGDITLDNAITTLENALNTRVSSLETLTTSNDLNLDTIQEIVTFIKDNRADLDSISLDWSAILNKPATFTPSVHNHTIVKLQILTRQII